MDKLKFFIICIVFFTLNYTNAKALDCNLYCNTRFNYNISYPKSWTSIKESDNGDGAILYNNDENDIRVYANYSIDNNENPDVHIEKFLVDNKKENIKILHYICLKNNVEYNLYAKITQEFYNKEKDTIFNIIKSFQLGT